MNIKPASILKFVLILVTAGALLFFAFKGISFNHIMAGMMKANFLWLLISVLISMAALISRAYRWKLLIEPLGYSPPLRKTFYALMVGYFANLAFPRLGEVTRCGSLNRSASIPFAGLVGTVIVERAVDVVCLLGCIFLTAAFEYKRLGNFLTDKIIDPTMGKIKHALNSTYAIAAILLLIVVVFILVRYLRNRKGGNNKDSRMVHFIKELIRGLKSIAYLKHTWQFVFHSVLIWVLYYFSTYIAFFSLPATGNLGPGAALFILTLGGLAMSAPVQGGIGIYHLLVSEGLILYGLSRQDGLTFATLVHASQLVVVVLLGSASLFFLFLENKKSIIGNLTEIKGPKING
jgi:uncharacterized protein (TIRG00374 family)